MRIPPRTIRILALAGAMATIGALSPIHAAAGTPFSNTPLYATWTPPAGLTTSPVANSTGNSEPAIAFGADGRMFVDGLAWLPFQVNMWKGSFGSTPSYFGAMDTNLPHHGNRTALGDGDADLTVTSNGTTLLADLNFLVNPPFSKFQNGVGVTRCPASAKGPADCTTAILDTSNADRPWITSEGTNAWAAWHDSKSSTLIRVKRSTDDGRTWTHAGSPIPGQGATTGTCTFNNEIGPIVADPTNGDVFAIYICGDTTTKGRSFTGNNVVLSRSTDGGLHWRSTVIFHEPRDVQLANFFPSITVDPANGNLYATACTLEGVFESSSTDHGRTWADPVQVSTANTTVMPWIAAQDGKVDVVYYGTSASSPDAQHAVWNVYDSQFSNGSWNVLKVSNTPNRVGPVCLEGSACTENRQLLDLFEEIGRASCRERV